MSLFSIRRRSGGVGTVMIVVIAVIAIAVFGYLSFFSKSRPSVAIEVTKPDEVLVGEPFSVTVAYSNESEQVLKNVQVGLSVPEDIIFVGGKGERARDESVGDIGPGSMNQKTFTLLVTKGEQSVRQLVARLRYGIEGSAKAQFEETTKADIVVGRSSIALHLTTPETVFSGERFETKIEYQNDSKQEFKNLKVVAEYPQNYQIEETNPFPSQKNNEWDIRSILPGERGTILVSGNAIGEEGSFFSLNVKLLGEFFGEEQQLNAQEASVGISVAPLSLRILLNGENDPTVKSGDTLRYALMYKNNSDTPLKDLSAQVGLTGELYDFRTLHTQGSFNSITNMLSWAVANVKELSSLEPGEEGTLTFEVNTKRDFTIKRLSDKNYTLRVRANMQSPTVPPGVQAQKTVSIAMKETKVQGRLALKSSGYFYDAQSGILNKGQYPPRVNQPTQYTMHWKLTNYSTDVKNIRVSAFLQSGAKFTGEVKTNIDSPPIYNSETGEVVWEVPFLSSGRGIINTAPEVVFQIEVIPPITALNQDLALLSESRFRGEDVFTGSILEGVTPPISTALPDDTKISTQNRQVQN
ncbi:MAG: hypothetical protein AAB495_02550 [Patescibacteria group bacterium]